MSPTASQRKKIKSLKSVKLKQRDVSSEVLVTAIDVKCNFTNQINARPFSQKLAVRPYLKFQDFLSEKKIIMYKNK